MCDCPSDKLCDACIDSRVMQLKGVAAARAHRWVGELALRVSRQTPWPRGSAKMLRLARHEVADLTRDERLLTKLTEICAEAAEREWNDAATNRAVPA